MSLVHRVVILNKPLKIRGLTVSQWIMMTLALGAAIGAGSIVPGTWKFAGVPTGFWLGMIIFCGALVFTQALQMKPLTWWRNMIAYRMKLVPVVYLPHSEKGTIYPDPTMIDPGRKEDLPFVSREDRPIH
jgi:hypothetical protein